MIAQQDDFLRFIKLLSDNGVLKHVILIGSWVEFLYRETGRLLGFESNIRTLDIDFLVKNLRRPMPPSNIAGLAREAGYYVESDCLDGTTRILDKSGLEIEFLINKKGQGIEETLRTNIGVTAQAMRHMEIILNNVETIEYLGFCIEVPSPEAYAIHKMVINGKRKEKTEKDRQAIINIWNHLDKEEINRIKETLSKKERKAVNEFIALNEIG